MVVSEEKSNGLEAIRTVHIDYDSPHDCNSSFPMMGM